jgi:hypothetical protein
MRVNDQRSAPASLPSRNRPGTHFTGGRVGQTAGLGRCGKSRPHRVSIPGQAVNGILPNCEVYIHFRLLGVTESSVMPILKVPCLYVNVSVCTIRRAHVTVSSIEHWHSSEEYLAQKDLYYYQIFIVQGFEHV